MAIKTVAQYIESIRDKREVWIDGERVEDLTTHPHIRTAVEMGAMDYAIAQDPRYRDLMIEIDEKGEPYHFCFKPMMTREDLMRKREVVQVTARTCFGMPGGAKFTGIDGLNSITAVTRRMDKEIGTSYAPRVEAFRQEMKANDSAVAVAVTDVKGDRSLRPSKQRQHPDFYLHVVDETRDGIVVRGAKVHISTSATVHDIIVIPTRAMLQDDTPYALAFAVKPDAKGLIHIMAEHEVADDANDLDSPLAAHIYTSESLLVFDDVFIPNDRVFLKGEWRYAGQFAYMFANYHRASADAYKSIENEMLVGAAALMAEYNGIAKAPHIQDKLAWLAWYTETTDALGRASCFDCSEDRELGVVFPDPVYSNAAKFFFAEHYHQAIKHLVDITGGIVATIPSSKDLLNPQIGPYVEKYLAGKEGVPTEHRFRMIKLVKDICSYFMQGVTLHGEGSLAAQRMSIRATSDWARYISAAKRAAGIREEKPHPSYGSLLDYPAWTWRKEKNII
ncbi:MAG: hypothetical protein JW950_08925 [Deltaproteobacteria bacterium]|nr:hypothetical protein [Deltaproteobacteria bacterium]